MKIISFLGTGDYSETTYVFGEQEHNTSLFPVALYEFFQPTANELLVCVTDEAEEKHFSSLCNELRGKIQPKAIKIPIGRNPSELWTIFDELAKNVEHDDSVVFDITHALRSIPVLVFIAIAYLRSAKNVRIEAIINGAFELRDGTKTPVFDLSPFIKVLDWTIAADRFLKTGDESNLVNELRLAHDIPNQSLPRGTGDLPRQLQQLATCIESVTEAMRTTRIHDALESVRPMLDRLERARSEVETWAQPFAVILDQVRQAYQPFVLQNPQDFGEELKIQLKIVHWYIEKAQIVQATLLEREWIVSLLVLQLDLDSLRDRKRAEDILNSGAHKHRKKSPLPAEICAVENIEQMLNVWNQLSNLRNDIAHCGMRDSTARARDISHKAKKIFQHLTDLSNVLL